HALALPGRAGDEQVRHAREVRDDRLARNVIAQAQREQVGTLAEGGRLDDLADRDEAGRFVRHLDADGRLAGDGRFDPQRRRGKGKRQVSLQRGDAFDLDTRPRLDLELREGRPRVDPHDLALDAERLQGALDDLDVALDLVGHPLTTRGDGVEECDGGQLPFDLRDVRSEERRVGKDGRSGWSPKQKTAYEIVR